MVVKGRAERVIVNNFSERLEIKMKPFIPNLVAQISRKKRVGVLISGSGTNLQALIDATRASDLGAEIALVISNKDDVLGLKRAQDASIPTKVIRHRDFPQRVDFDAALHSELVKADIDIVCLAGFMRILSEDFTRKWKGKLLNVHPALLPLFKGTHAQKQALDAGVRVSGCTVHFVDETVDGGWILTQEAVPVEIGDTEESLSSRILIAEHKAFPRALEWVARGKVRIGEDNQLIWNLN